MRLQQLQSAHKRGLLCKEVWRAISSRGLANAVFLRVKREDTQLICVKHGNAKTKMNYAGNREGPPRNMNSSTLIICHYIYYITLCSHMIRRVMRWWQTEIHYVDAVDTWHGWKSSTSKHFFNTLQEVDAAKNNHICLGELLAIPTIDANASLFSKDNCSSPCNWTCVTFPKENLREVSSIACHALPLWIVPKPEGFPGFLRSLMMSIPWCSQHEMTLDRV